MVNRFFWGFGSPFVDVLWDLLLLLSTRVNPLVSSSPLLSDGLGRTWVFVVSTFRSGMGLLPASTPVDNFTDVSFDGAGEGILIGVTDSLLSQTTGGNCLVFAEDEGGS